MCCPARICHNKSSYRKWRISAFQNPLKRTQVPRYTSQQRNLQTNCKHNQFLIILSKHLWRSSVTHNLTLNHRREILMLRVLWDHSGRISKHFVKSWIPLKYLKQPFLPSFEKRPQKRSQSSSLNWNIFNIKWRTFHAFGTWFYYFYCAGNHPPPPESC